MICKTHPDIRVRGIDNLKTDTKSPKGQKDYALAKCSASPGQKGYQGRHLLKKNTKLESDKTVGTCGS